MIWRIEESVRVLIVIVSLALLVVACKPSTGILVPMEPTAADLMFASENKPLDVHLLEQVFSRGSLFQVMTVTNRMLATETSEELVGYLMSLWQLKPAAVERVDRDFVNGPSVRVLLANVLAQSAASHVLKADATQFVETLRSGLSMTDREIVWAAMSGLHLFFNDADIEKIVAIAEGGDKATRTVALGALSSSCATNARRRFDEIVAAADEDTRTRAREILTSGEGARQANCSN